MAIDVITLRGGVVEDAELRFTPSGAAVAEFRIAQSDNKLNEQTKQWDTTRALYLTCTLWDESPQYKQNPVQWAQLAGNLTKGQRVAVRGKLHTEQWEDRDGNKRSVIKFLAESFAVEPDTRNQQSQPQGQQQAQGAGWNGQQGGFSGQSQQPPQNQGGFQGQQQQSFQNDPWNSAPPQGQNFAGGGGHDDSEPPF